MIGRVFSFTGPQVGNPSKDANNNFDLIERNLEEEEIDVDLYSVIVFTSPGFEVEIEGEGASHPVMNLSELERYVRGIEPDQEFTNSDRAEVVDVLGQGEELEEPEKARSRRPVKIKKRVAS